MAWIQSERVAWVLAVTCALMASGLEIEVKRTQQLSRERLEKELVDTRQKYFNLIDSNRVLVKKYSRLKSRQNDTINTTF
jgi:hypothetical protein